MKDPYVCSVETRHITELNLEGFCTNVRNSGGLAMSNIRPATAQGILTSCGLRLNILQGVNDTNSESRFTLSPEFKAPPPSASASIAPRNPIAVIQT